MASSGSQPNQDYLLPAVVAFAIFFGVGLGFAIVDKHVRGSFVSGLATAVGLFSVGHGVHVGLRHFGRGKD